MITISACMIVKNEEANLDRCLKGVSAIADEIIIVDTGSTDRTKEIAAGYTDKIYDYAWTGSFADARNYAFSLAGCDYIYSADADEELDETNVDRFRHLKEALLPEIDIVQMYYCNQLENNTIYNFDKELRPKLYKRLRNFVWEEIIHEAVRLEPLVFDSDIEIIHRPGEGHAIRDLAAFERLVKVDGDMSNRLIEIYAKELYVAGSDEHFVTAKGYFGELADRDNISEDLLTMALAVCARAARIESDDTSMLKYVSRAAAGECMCSELCCELGQYFYDRSNYTEAHLWYYNAMNEAVPMMNIRYGKEIPESQIEKCMEAIGQR